MLFCAKRIFKCQLYFCASHSPSLFGTLLLYPSSSCSLVGQAKPCNAEPSSVQTDEIAWEHRREIGSIAEASQFMEVAFYLWCHSSCHLNHLPSIFLCAYPPPPLLFSTHPIFSPPLHLSARDEPSEGKRTVRRGRRESGLELWGSTGGEQLNIEQLWRSDVMVWQRGGELLESPGQNFECVDAGIGKTTEVKRCLVSPN